VKENGFEFAISRLVVMPGGGIFARFFLLLGLAAIGDCPGNGNSAWQKLEMGHAHGESNHVGLGQKRAGLVG
jgi:hypothetical protein